MRERERGETRMIVKYYYENREGQGSFTQVLLARLLLLSGLPYWDDPYYDL